MENCILSVDAGGTFLKAALLSESGEIYKKSFMSIPVDSNGSLESIEASYSTLAKAAKAMAEKESLIIKGVGICIPGPFDYDEGVCRMTHKYVSIFGIPMRPWFTSVLSDIPIKFIHDSAGFILGATRSAEYKKYNKIGGVMLGTGLGFATMEKGVVLKNEKGGPAVSVYNRPYRDKIAEEYASRRAVINIFKEMEQDVPDTIDVYDIAMLARAGHQNAVKTFRLLGQYLGEILHDILIEGDYECLLLGGAISKSADLYIDSLKEAIADVQSLKLVTAVDDIDNIPLYGASRAILG